MAALMAAAFQVSAVEFTGVPNGDYGDYSYSDSNLTVNSHVMLNEDDWVLWTPSGNATLSGSGSISCPDVSEWGPGVIPTWGIDILSDSDVTIESGVTLRNVNIYIERDGAKLVCKNTFHNAYIEGGNVDLTHATITGWVDYGMRSGTVMTRPTFEVGAGSSIDVWRESEQYAGPYKMPVMNGNVVIGGNGVNFGSGELAMELNRFFAGDYASYQSAASIYFSKEETGYDFGTLNITGTLTFNSVVYATFDVEGEYNSTQNGSVYTDTYKSEYEIPGENECLIICSGVKNLHYLRPIATREDTWETYDIEGEYWEQGGYIYYKSLDEYSFYAKAEEDGRVGIYLVKGEGGSEVPPLPDSGQGGSSGGSQTPVVPPTPSIPDSSIVVGAGETVILGKDEDTTPSKDKPIHIQGGIADASGLKNELLNNQVIQGASGTLKTGADQKMEITGSGSLKYSIVGADDATPGADLDIKLGGQLELQGKQYNTAKATIHSGVLSIGSGTTLGMGTGKTAVEVKKGASLTNFGKVAGDVTLAEGSTMLNQNKVEGDVTLLGKSTMVNNGAMSGTVTVGSGALLSGTGTAGAAVLRSGAAMHVGNSPGYQKYGSLTIDRGTSISFTVDGTQAATLEKIGEGTHSVLNTDTLTINDGEGKVALDVEVTLGIVNAGFEPVEVTLVDAGTGNAQADDFSITLKDNELLEDGATVTWDAATQSLTLSGSVSKSALAALMDSNSANVANTMWASANAVQEIARTAEGQYLIGMPGQSTLWGAGMGSFMDISGDHGFTSNAGGYAVGIQHAFTESFRCGVALGGMFGTFKSDDNQLKVDQKAVLPVLTAQYVTALDATSSLTVSGHLAYGEVANEADTYQMGTAGTAEWDDRVLNLGGRVAWNKQLTDNTTATLFSGLTYQSVDQDSFTEKYTGGEREYRSGSMSSLSLPLGVTVRGVYGMGGTNIFVPEVTVAYIRDIARDNPEVKTSVYGFNRVGKGTNIGRDAFMLNAGANWMFDSSWSVGAFYTLEARSSQVNQSVNASLRYCF